MKTIKSKFKFIMFIIIMSSTIEGFTQNFDEIGIKHNELASKISSSDLLNNKSNDALNIISMRIKDSYNTAEEKKLMNSYPKNIYNYGNPKLFLQEMNGKVNFSEKLLKKMNILIDKVLVMKTEKEIFDFVENEKENIKNLSKKDAESYLLSLSTLKHSATFWNRKAENGKNYFNKEYKGGPFTNGDERATATLSLGWKVALCDVVGALAGAYKGGWVGALIWGVASSVMTYIGAQ